MKIIECTCGAAKANSAAQAAFRQEMEDLREGSKRASKMWNFQMSEAQQRGVIPFVIGVIPGDPIGTEVCEHCHGTGWGTDETGQMTGEPCCECDGFGATFIYEDDLK